MEQSPYLNIISESKVAQTLKLMGRQPNQCVTGELARELCERLGRNFTPASGSSYTLPNTFTATGDQWAQKSAVFNAASSGTMVYEAATVIIRVSMENWYKVAFPASEIASGAQANALQQAFETFFTQHHAPLNAALFTSRDTRVANYFYYFSPGAAEIAKPLIESYGGVPTSAPILSDDTILLVGHSDARQNLLQSPPK